MIERLGDRILGRVALDDIVDPLTGDVLVEANSLIDEEKVRIVEEAGIDRVTIRSVLTCQTRRGVCVLCYGRDLARGYEVNVGEAIGIIAAQSIGEPGTQLTMRTFHVGGVSQVHHEESTLEARNGGTIKLVNCVTVPYKASGKDVLVVMNRHGEIIVEDDSGRERERYGFALRGASSRSRWRAY